MKNGNSPKPGELYLSNRACKSNWLSKSCFKLDTKGILRKINQEGSTFETVLAVPKEFQEQALRLCHDIPAAAHQGIERTKARVKEHFFWYSMSRDVRHYVITCKLCNKNKKPTRHAKAPMTKHHAGFPMERVHLDFLGPLPKTAQGNEYILMMVDQFSKWCECIPLASQTAEQTAKGAVNEFFSRFGYPLAIFTDQGRNLESALFQSVCDLLKIHKTRSTAFRPSGNGQVERYNRTLMDAIR